jgi:hypothetical protein
MQVEVHEHDLAAAMIASGRLTATDALRRAMIERELCSLGPRFRRPLVWPSRA